MFWVEAGVYSWASVEKLTQIKVGLAASLSLWLLFLCKDFHVVHVVSGFVVRKGKTQVDGGARKPLEEMTKKSCWHRECGTHQQRRRVLGGDCRHA